MKNTEKIILVKHVTDGGAIYFTDNHNFAKAKVIIRIDGGLELLKFEVK